MFAGESMNGISLRHLEQFLAISDIRTCWPSHLGQKVGLAPCELGTNDPLLAYLCGFMLPQAYQCAYHSQRRPALYGHPCREGGVE